MHREQLPLPGLIRLAPFHHPDSRGSFTRIFRHSEVAAALGLDLSWRESYISTSVPGVIRGMHCQFPPHDHWKLVTCLAGAVLDVVVDLRPGPHYGQWTALALTASNRVQVLIPPGCAHGFAVDGAEPATLLYHTTTEHAPSHDTGIRWDSFGFAWPVPEPILSPRDASLPPLAEFVTPW